MHDEIGDRRSRERSLRRAHAKALSCGDRPAHTSVRRIRRITAAPQWNPFAPIRHAGGGAGHRPDAMMRSQTEAAGTTLSINPFEPVHLRRNRQVPNLNGHADRHPDSPGIPKSLSNRHRPNDAVRPYIPPTCDGAAAACGATHSFVNHYRITTCRSSEALVRPPAGTDDRKLRELAQKALAINYSRKICVEYDGASR